MGALVSHKPERLAVVMAACVMTTSPSTPRQPTMEVSTAKGSQVVFWITTVTHQARALHLTPSSLKTPLHSQSQAGSSAGFTEKGRQETKQFIAQFDSTVLLSTRSDIAPWAVLWVGGPPLWVGGQPHPYPKWCLVGGWVDPPSAKKHLGGWVVWDVFSWGPPPRPKLVSGRHIQGM